MSSVAAFGQADVNFANGATFVNAPIYDYTGTNKLTGSNYLADLFYGAAGTATTALTDDGLHVPIGTIAPGIFMGGGQVLPIPAGSVELQVRVWQAVAGATWAAATGGATDVSFGALDSGTYVTNGGTQWGASTAITVTLPATPAPPASMVGLQSFSLTLLPEPSTITLGALGAVSALVAYRRRKA